MQSDALVITPHLVPPAAVCGLCCTAGVPPSAAVATVSVCCCGRQHTSQIPRQADAMNNKPASACLTLQSQWVQPAPGCGQA
jgi:hypothetical protein